MAVGNLIKRLTRRPDRPDVPDDGAAPAAEPTVPAGPSSVDDALRETERLVEAGRLAEAAELLAATWRRTPSPEVETRWRDLRHDLAVAAPTSPGREPWPPEYPDPRPGEAGRIPEVHRSELSTTVMGGAVAHHGALCVRELFDDVQVAAVLDVLHRARRSQDDDVADRWYHPLSRTNGALREHVRRHGGTWLADSPAATAVVIEELGASGVVELVTEHFGERPHFSLEKSTLRRTPPEDRLTGWHQDGSFLGAGVRTMNVWIALSPCGGSLPASGLEVIPHRLEELLPKDPALGNAGVSFDLMEEVLAETPSVRPEFRPGDAMIFDERFMHRTALGPHLTEDRYALECWFFAPSHSADDYTPLLV